MEVIMKNILLLLIVFLMMFSISLARANNKPQGIDLGEYAFGIPAAQLNFSNQSPFTLSFWVNVKEYNHTTNGTNFIHIKDIYDDWPLSDNGYLWSAVLNDIEEESGMPDNSISMYARNKAGSEPFYFNKVRNYSFNPGEWNYVSLVHKYTMGQPEIVMYVNGESTLEINLSSYGYLLDWKKEFIILIGGYSFGYSPLDAYIDKVQFYKKALSQEEIIESMTAPLLNDASLLGYWDFEAECITNADGFMKADNGTIKATMYEIISNSYGQSIGIEIQSFTFGEGVNPESVIQRVEESVVNETKIKAYISNEILNIENVEGINSVVVYDSMGRVITSTNANGPTSTQIALPSNISGVLIVKVNSEIIKVMSN